MLAALESRAPDRARHSLGKDIRLHRRRRRQRIPRRHRSASGRDRDRPRACGDRSAGSLRIPTVAVIHGFCLGGGLEVALACQIAHCDRRRALRLSGGDARPASRPRRHRALHRAGQSDAGDDADADRQAPSMRAAAKSLGLVDAVTQERHVRNAVKDAVFGRLKRAGPGPAQHAAESRSRARPARLAHARGGREGRAARALSGALRADRSLGEAWRRQGRDAEGRESARSPG